MAWKLNRAEVPTADDTASHKRRKTDQPADRNAAKSARDIPDWLSFRPDAPALLQGVQRFKLFLDGILYPPEGHNVQPQVDLLYDYLYSQKLLHIQKAERNVGSVVYLPELVDAWHFASTQNEDRLFSLTTAVLALLLKATTSKIDFRPYCSLICETLLAEDQVKLLAKALSFASKEHILSPSMRLLTEIVSFDGGAFAAQLYKRRDEVFEPAKISRYLSLTRTAQKADDGKPRPSVRFHAVRYLLANLRLQNVRTQVEIANQDALMTPLFRGLANDPPSLVLDIVTALETNIAQNPDVPWKTKSQIFTASNLSLLYELYQVDLTDDGGSQDKIHDVLHRFVLWLCTSPESGVFKRSPGWYLEAEDEISRGNNYGPDSLEMLELRKQVKHSKLATFAHRSLRPLSNVRDQELLLAILRTAPELVADYWTRSTNFTFDPKLTSTWIGYASLLFSSISLPVPEYFGRRVGYASHPPDKLIAIENIIPSPLDSKVLTKCLHHSSTLVQFFAVRILIAALQKFKRVLALYDAANLAALSKSWSEEKEELSFLLKRRIPDFREVIAVFRKTPSSNSLQYEAVTRLITLYYEALPLVAFEQNLDVSTALTEALQTTQKSQKDDEPSELQLLALTHLIRIAEWSMSMRWWNKPQSLRFSPFLTLLLAYARSETNVLKDAECLLKSITENYYILQSQTEDSAFGALVRSLVDGAPLSNGALDFVDDCLQRYVKRPIAYSDEFVQLMLTRNLDPEKAKPVSLLVFTIAEQWPFVAKHRAGFSQDIGRWISTFFVQLLGISEDFDVLCALRSIMKRQDEQNELSIDLVDQKTSRLTLRDSSAPVDTEMIDGEGPTGDCAFDISICNPPEEPTSPNFLKFRTEDLAMLLESDGLDALILCLSSTDAVNRAQALTSLQHFIIRLEESAYPEKDMVYLLLGELVETYRNVPPHQLPATFIVTTFAVHAIRVIRDPSHTLYSKMCNFLTGRPKWTPTSLIKHFLKAILAEPPTEDSDAAPWKERMWMLGWILDALRTKRDGELTFRTDLWEQLGVLGGHTSLGNAMSRGEVDGPAGGRLQHKIRPRIISIFGRALCVGMAAELAVRAGGLAWMAMWSDLGWIDPNVAKSFQRAMAGNKAVQEWSFGTEKPEKYV